MVLPYYSLLQNVPRPDIGGAIERFGTTLAEAYAARSVMEARQREAQRQAEIQAQARAQFEADALALRDDPSPKNLLWFSTKYPDLMKQAEAGVSAIRAEERENIASSLKAPYFALESNDQDTFKETAQGLLVAYQNGGRNEDARVLKSAIDAADKGDVNRARLLIGARILSLETPEKFKGTSEYLTKGSLAFEQEESAAKKTEAEAKKAAIEADFAKEVQELGIVKTKEQIQNLAADRDIAKANLDIQRAKLALDREMAADARAARQLDLNKTLEDRRQKLVEKEAQFSKDYGTLEDTERLIMEVMSTDPNVRKRAHGRYIDIMRRTTPLAAATIVGQKGADYEEKANTIGSRLFLNAIEAMRGFGTLSENEGKRLQAAQGSLSLRQSVESMDKVLKDVLDVVRRNKMAAKMKYGVSEPKPEEKPGGAPAPPGAPSGEQNFPVDF